MRINWRAAQGFGDPAWTAPPPSSSPAQPSPRILSIAAYDYALDRVLIKDGGDEPSEMVWAWAVGTNAWTNLTALSSRGPFGPGAFAWDPRRSIGVYFGGAMGNEVWQWDAMSGEWTQEPSAGQAWPPPRSLSAMVLDRDRGAMMLFGGNAFPNGPALNDLWQWYPDTGWKLLDDGTSGHAPPPRFMFGMTYDPAIARLVVFGGNGDGTELDDVWTYQGSP